MLGGRPTLRRGSAAEPLRCAVLVSGSGSGMVALIQAQRAFAEASYSIALVVCNNPTAPAVAKALDLGLPTLVADHRVHAPEGRREAHEAVVLEALRAHDVELVVLSGYMRLLSPWFLQHWGAPVLNIHPSLLPAFPGAHAHRDVLEAGVSVTGCTVHLVDEGMDTGLVLEQTPVPVLTDDNESTLSERVKVEEHRLFPSVLGRIADGIISVTADGRSVLSGRMDD